MKIDPSRVRAHASRAASGVLTVPLALIALVLIFWPLGTAAALAERRQAEPEAQDTTVDRDLAIADRYMVSTANRYASEAAGQILSAGGSAVDAAIAAQLVLGLVEPQSSGLGGGAFLVHWDQATRTLTGYDGRETAPAAARPDRFLSDGEPIAFDAAVASGLSIGTPGLVRLLEHVHRKHGRLPWARLFEPAIALADSGFVVSRRLNFLLVWNGAERFAPEARRYFFDASGRARSTGFTLANPAYAATLRAIASGGADAFYRGPVADAIVAAVRDAPRFSGDVTLKDLANYSVREREILCVPYRKVKVCGMGAPSSGGVGVAETLMILDGFDLGQGPGAAMQARAMHLIIEAEKLAYADRDRYLADPEFVRVPAGLTDPGYVAERRKLIDPSRAMQRPAAGEPPGLDRRAFGIDQTVERSGTSHISVVDQDGNAVAMTTTIEGAFGSGVMAAGFLLNNELTDFSFRSVDGAGTPIANRVEPLKRPRSTMAPTIVLDEKGEFSAALGSPGGSRIIFYVVKSLVALIDWQMDPQAAAALRNFGSAGGAVEVEYGWRALADAFALQSFGHDVDGDLMNSGVHIVARRNGRLEGGADPRREGAALGQ